MSLGITALEVVALVAFTALVGTRVIPRVLDYVANPFVGGIFAGDPEQLSARHALPRLHDLEHTHGSVMKAMGQMLRAGRGPGGPVGPTH